jgi:hypothetical protein
MYSGFYFLPTTSVLADDKLKTVLSHENEQLGEMCFLVSEHRKMTPQHICWVAEKTKANLKRMALLKTMLEKCTRWVLLPIVI